jgi:DNA-binding CsgD family transcriptional regulator
VTMNSIKSYVRSAYHKMGVERRTQAVLWAVAHGFVPDLERTSAPSYG